MKKTGVVLAGFVFAVIVIAGIAKESRAESEYRNIINLERFVDNLKDPAEIEYTNTMTLEKFVTAMKDPCQKDDFSPATLVLAMCENIDRTPIY